MHDDLDFEGKMHDTSEIDIARADLYKLAKYSMKLFKLVEGEAELEGWVQAKITKAADYISSVYHFMEYELKVSEYGDKLENAEMYSESVRRAFVQKLNEAKEKLEKVKEKEKKKHKKEIEEEVDKSKIPAAQRKAKGGDWKVTTKDLEKEQEKSPTTKAGLKRKAKEVGIDESAEKADKDYDKDGKIESPKDEVWGSRLKAASAKKQNKKLDSEVRDTELDEWYHYDQLEGPPKAKRMGGHDELARREDEFKRYGKNPLAKSGALRHEYKKKDKYGDMYKIAGPKGKLPEDTDLDEAAPSAGMTKKEKSTVVKKAKAGKDIGKPGKGFAKVEKAAKAGGAKDPKAVAAAAMWKQQAKK